MRSLKSFSSTTSMSFLFFRHTKSLVYVPFKYCLLSDDNKIKMARKPWKNQKENPVGCTEKDKKWKVTKPFENVFPCWCHFISSIIFSEISSKFSRELCSSKLITQSFQTSFGIEMESYSIYQDGSYQDDPSNHIKIYMFHIYIYIYIYIV